nr:MAG TPA: hypothetical protein [Caudoviricetes sp.]
MFAIRSDGLKAMNLKDTVEIVKAGGSDETNQCRNSI